MFTGFFGYLIGGALIGMLARLLKPGPDPIGILMTVLIGATGAAIGGSFAGRGLLGWVAAIVSSIVLLYVFERITRRKPGPRPIRRP